MQKSANPHPCTKREAEEIKRIIWKYFDRRVADNVLKTFGKRKGRPEIYGVPYCKTSKTLVKNVDAAKREYFDYISKHQIHSVSFMMGEEENAIIYDSGFIYPGY
jgi:hypothetical protein